MSTSTDSQGNALVGSTGLGSPSGAELELLIKEITRLLAMAGSSRGDVSIQFSLYASVLFDELLSKVDLREHSAGVVDLVGFPLSSAADIIDCMGEGSVSALLYEAVKSIRGDSDEGLSKGEVKRYLDLFADCMGWQVRPDKMISDEQRGASVLVSFAASLNKWLEELASS